MRKLVGILVLTACFSQLAYNQENPFSIGLIGTIQYSIDDFIVNPFIDTNYEAAYIVEYGVGLQFGYQINENCGVRLSSSLLRTGHRFVYSWVTPDAECGVHSNEKGFEIDHNRIAKINLDLWGE